jgi:hypothetical protein
MPEKLTLYVCTSDNRGPKQHPCRRAQETLRAEGHDFEKVIFAKGKPLGLFTTGTRPELKAISGQEKLPVLKLPDGGTVNGGASIAAWAKANPPTPPSPPAATA